MNVLVDLSFPDFLLLVKSVLMLLEEVLLIPVLLVAVLPPWVLSACQYTMKIKTDLG